MALVDVVRLTVLTVTLLVCTYSSAQDGGCSPDPPALMPSGPFHGANRKNLLSNNVPVILTGGVPDTIYRPLIGGYGTNIWAVFSESQVRQFGLWCQVRPVNTNNMSDSNIGDWYYPTASGGFTILTNTANDGTPYQSLKCTNQIGLVVDGNVTNYQGIVRCTTTVPGLNTDSNYMAIYTDSVFETLRTVGPTVDTNMTFSILSSRDAGPNITFRLSFNISFGLPSLIQCTRNSTAILLDNNQDGIASGVHYEVIRSQYISSSQPDMTRLSFTQTRPRMETTYSCTVTVRGRRNITFGQYDYDGLGNGTSTATVTVADVPTAVTANRTGYNSVLVSWTAPSLAPAGYEVFYQTASAGVSSRLSGGNTSNTELTLTGLTLGETYSIFVVAYGAEGDPVLPSAHSNIALIIIPAQLLSLTPSTSSIMVSWTPPQFAPDSYTISYSCQLLCDSELYLSSSDTVDGTATTHTIISLNAGSNCTVSLTAVFGSSSGNTVTSFTNTTSAAPTDDPGGLASASVESRSLSVLWGTVPCPDQRGPITGYRLRYSNGTSIVNTTGEGSRQHVLTGLTPFTSYSVQVAAVNDGGTGPFSDPALTVETLQDVPGSVSGLSATHPRNGIQLTISWRLPSEPNGVIIEYEVCSNRSGVFSYTNTSATQHILKDLAPNTVVTFSVRAYTIIGPGENVTSQASTGSVPVVSGVSVVPLLEQTCPAVRVSWTPVNLTMVDHYAVHYTTVSGVNGTITFPASAFSGVVSGLQEGQQYQFSVTVTLNVNGELFTGLPNYTQSTIFLNTSPSMAAPVSTSSGVAGWVLFAVTLVGSSIIIIIQLMCLVVLRQQSVKQKSNSTFHNHGSQLSTDKSDGIYDTPELPAAQSEEMKMTECTAYSTHQPQSSTDEYESINKTEL